MKHTYTLSDLRDPAFAEKMPMAKLAVIGFPIKHSASPQMHQAAIDQANFNLRYIRVEVNPNEVADCFHEMERLHFIGCNVTVPHKLEAMSLCNELTDDASALGATNTILFKNGIRLGHNTDGKGIAQAIYEEFGKSLGELKVLILGAGGGAGRAIATQCAREGAPAIYLSNRTQSKLEPIANSLIQKHGAKKVQSLSTEKSTLITAAQRADLIINATSLGLSSDDPLPMPYEGLQKHHSVFDTIYNPKITPLLKQASNMGAQTSNGLSMLIHQGANSFRFWLNHAPDISAMRNALL